jgi:outer membrane protein
MKKSIRSLVAILALGAVALTARAEPALKLVVVDLGKIYDAHYKTQEQTNKINADKAQAEAEVEKMNKEGNALVDEYKNLQEQSTNAALTPEAKAKAQNDAQKKFDEIQAKQNEIRTFIQNSTQSLQQRMQTFRSLMLEEISKLVTDVAKRHGATLVLDKFGPSLIGISNVIYSDAGFDITDEVQREINKDRPAGAAAPAPAAATPSTSAPAPAAAPAAGSGPTINLPIKK